jgi:hypothetical protein
MAVQFVPFRGEEAEMVEMTLSLQELIHAAHELSAAERLLLAKVLLDSLVGDEVNQLAVQKHEPAIQLPRLEDVVTQIKATPSNPQQIQRATQTIDEVMADWNMQQPDEPRLTIAEWEQTWWAVRQEMKDHRYRAPL